jgi:hypothetical protein
MLKTTKSLVIGLCLFSIGVLLKKLNAPIEIDISSFRVLPIQTHFSDAMEKAVEWAPDAYLNTVDASFSASNDNDPLQLSYGFRSKKEPGKWLSVYYSNTDPIHIKISEGEFPQGSDRPLTKEIDIANLPFDSLEAIIIALENGGEDFLVDHRGSLQGSFLELEQENMALGEGEHMWHVVFSSSSANLDTLYITLDAYSGKVVETYRTNQ